MLYCICDPKPEPGQPHSPACRFQNFERDAPPGQRNPDRPAEKFRQEYPTASQIIRGHDLPDEDEVTITYDDPVPDSVREAFRGIYDVIAEIGQRISAAYRIIAEAREAAGVKPGEPLLGLFTDPDPDPDPDEEPIQSDLTVTELLDDLEDRIRRGVARLDRVKASYPSRDETYAPEIKRLNGKIEGMRVVQDWLRSYR